MYYNEEDIGPRVRKLGSCPDTGRFPAVSSVRCCPFTPNLGICASKLVTLSSDMFPQTKSSVSILPLGGSVLLGKLWSSDLGGTASANRIFSSFKKPLRNIKKTLGAWQNTLQNFNLDMFHSLTQLQDGIYSKHSSEESPLDVLSGSVGTTHSLRISSRCFCNWETAIKQLSKDDLYNHQPLVEFRSRKRSQMSLIEVSHLLIEILFFMLNIRFLAPYPLILGPRSLGMVGKVFIN